jgi:serine/threonine protein kinase
MREHGAAGDASATLDGPSMSDSASASADPFGGQILAGRFAVQRVVRRTPDVVVYEGIDQKNQVRVRIERPVTLRLSPEQTAALKTVGASFAKLKGIPGLVKPIEGGIHGGLPFVVLPPPAGVSLAERLRVSREAAAGAVSARAIRGWLESAATTLDALHAVGICHGRLTPDQIMIAADGAVSIDGLPTARSLDAVGRPRGGQATDPARAYLAPEAGTGAAATPRGDQYALAAVAAEAVGRKTAIVEKALAKRPEERFPKCTAFAEALLTELGSPNGIPGARSGAAPAAELPLELADSAAGDASTAGPRPSTAPGQTYALELEEVDSQSQLRASRRTTADDEEEDLSEITFTKPGQNLLTPKSKLDQATSLAGSRASWRRMASQFKGLSAQQQWITRGVIGLVVAIAALWLVRVGWRAVDSLVQSGRQVAQTAMEKLKPDTQGLRESGEQFVEQMRDLWKEHAGNEQDAVATAEQLKVLTRTESDAWPGQPRNILDRDNLRAPTDLIEELQLSKNALTRDGLGVFYVDDPARPNEFPWIGGFGLLRKSRFSSKPLLHGTLVRRAEDGTVFVGRYNAAAVKDFWCVRGVGEDQIVSYAVLENRKDKRGISEIITNGAAFVMNSRDAACLAFVNSNGVVVGGQWCGAGRDENGALIFLQPKSMLSIEALMENDERVTTYLQQLERMLAEIPTIQEQAVVKLRKFVSDRRLR